MTPQGTPAAATIPVLETERLRLRAPTRADFELYKHTLMSPRATYIGGPFSLQRAWLGFCGDAGIWVTEGYGYWAVEVREGGRFAGMVGLGHPPHFPERELGWILQEDAEGQGIGFEAATAARDYAFETLGWPTIVSYIDEANARSIRLAERLGAVRDDAAAKPDPEDVVYRHRPGRPG